MDILSDSTSNNSSNVGFFEHMSNFDDQTKSDLLNMFQYTLLLIIPVILLDKAIGDLFTHDTDDKHAFELVFEVVTEVVLLIVGMYVSHRLVSYVPTYSGQSYKTVSFTSVLLVFVFIVTMFQTSLREKVDALVERVYYYIAGLLGVETFTGNNSNSPTSIQNNNNGNSGNNGNQNVNQHVSNSASGMHVNTNPNSTAISQLPTTNNLPNPPQPSHQGNVNVSNGPFTSFSSEPQPANSVLGGSLF